MSGNENEYDFFSDEAIEEYETEAINPYLENPGKGMELLSRILPKYRRKTDRTERQEALQNLDNLIDKKLPKSLYGLEDVSLLNFKGKMQKLSDQILKERQISQLSGKVIIGVGGKFSAGKSCFINSLLPKLQQDFLLPENQNATTSIPTYIVAGTENRVMAGLTDGSEVSLDSEAFLALTHAFYEQYRIGFSRFIRTLVLTTPAFTSPLSSRLALLDTPGYNKSESTETEGRTDAEIALTELRAADFLIWLVHIDNGIISESDLDLLEKLNPEKPPLIVFTHADEKTESQQRDVVTAGKNALKEAGIPCFDVVAYCSRTANGSGEEMLGTNRVQEFFLEADNVADERLDVPEELKETEANICKRFDQQETVLENNLKQLEHDIHEAEDSRYIRSLVNLYTDEQKKKRRFCRSRKDFKDVYEEIEKITMNLQGR